MRTLRITWTPALMNGSQITYSFETIVDEATAEQEGREAMKIITLFESGVQAEAGET